MKKLFILLAAAVLPFAGNLKAQTNLSLGAITNIVVAPFAMTLTSGPEQGRWGGGVLGFYNVPVPLVSGLSLGPGVGLYYLGQWSEFNGTVQLSYAYQVNSSITIDAFTSGGAGTSLSGAGTANGNATVISQTGAGFDYNLGRWKIGAQGFWGNIAGAGRYTGNDGGGAVTIQTSF